MEFKENDIVVDSKFNECFYYSEKNARLIKYRLRKATSNEEIKLKRSDKKCIVV